MPHTCGVVTVGLVESGAWEVGWRPPIKWSLCCPAFVCRQREVKGAAVLSRAANLWPYLPVKSIQVSESRAECAGGQLEGSTSGPLPPQGLSWGGTCLSLHTPSLPLGRSRSFRLLSPARARRLGPPRSARVPPIQVSHGIGAGAIHSLTCCESSAERFRAHAANGCKDHGCPTCKCARW